jgi:RNA 2',3'-cyclic 3'-phosphodiesterase
VRSFVAVDLPYPPALEALAGRAPEHFHLTLRFFEELPGAKLPEVEGAMAEVAGRFPAAELELRGVGAFPSERAPRVLWVGLGRGRELVDRLARELDAALGARGLPRDPRPFRAHATLRRLHGPRDLGWATGLLEEGRDVSFGRATVDALRLYESRLSAGGASHHRIGAAPLVDDPGDAGSPR